MIGVGDGGVRAGRDQQAASAPYTRRPLLHRLSTTTTRNASVDFSSWESSLPSRTRRANFIVEQKSRIYRKSMELEEQANLEQFRSNNAGDENENNNADESTRKKKMWRSFVRYMKEAWTGVISGTGMCDIYKCISWSKYSKWSTKYTIPFFW